VAVWPGFVGPSYVTQALTFDGERCINLYLEPGEGTGTSPAYLYPCPGLPTFCDIGGVGPGRGGFAQNGRAFAVTGGSLDELFTGGTATNRGSVAMDSGNAQLCSNGAAGGQLLITSGGLGYAYDLTTNTLTTEVTGANQCLFINGYGLVLDINTSTLKWSALEDFTSWDPLDIAQRNTASDGWVGMAKRLQEILVLGSQTGDWYYLTDDVTNPFAPIPNGFMEEGLAATDSMAEIANQIFWLSSSAKGQGRVLRARGYQPERISTYAVELAISRYPNIADAIGVVYQDQGHSFYVLTFPSEDTTWCYDLTTGLWHERGTWNGQEFTAWRGRWHASAFGKHLVGDLASGKIFNMTIDSTADGAGSTIVRMRQGPVLTDEHQRFSLASLMLDVQMGLGLTTGQGSDPQVMLQLSRDGGQMWGNERWVSAGRIGQYLARAKWTQLGQARTLVPRIVMSDPIPWRIANLFYEAA